MAALLDTQALLWWVNGDADRLGHRARSYLGSSIDSVFISLVSPWEMAIKQSIGKLALARPLDIFVSGALSKNGFAALAIELNHIYRTASLPLHHRDPFDRLLIAQALVEQLPIISNDKAFDAYDVERIW